MSQNPVLGMLKRLHDLNATHLIAILGLALLMVVHESGHFFVARAFGMRVTKFSIGFGPTFFKIVPRDGYFWFTTGADKIRLRLWKHDPERHGPTIYQVGMIPFLAYVQIAGMNPLEEIDEKDKGSYANASLIGRISTIFAGPFANYVFASVLFFASFLVGGRPTGPDEWSSKVTVLPGSPAAAATMKSGDRLVSIDGTSVHTWEEMAAAISRHPAMTIPIVVERGSERITLTVTPEDKQGKGKIGVSPGEPRASALVPVTVKEAAALALIQPTTVVKDIVISIGQVFSGRMQGELAGPVGIVNETAKAVQLGWAPTLFFLGALSAYLGAFNLIPFPALDGGRLMFLGYEATTRRRANARIEANIHAIGLAMMLSLILYVTFAKDLPNIGKPSPSEPASASPPAAAPPASGTASPASAPEAPSATPTAVPQGGK